jgi:hypothetical protein
MPTKATKIRKEKSTPKCLTSPHLSPMEGIPRKRAGAFQVGGSLGQGLSRTSSKGMTLMSRSSRSPRLEREKEKEKEKEGSTLSSGVSSPSVPAMHSSPTSSSSSGTPKGQRSRGKKGLKENSLPRISSSLNPTLLSAIYPNVETFVSGQSCLRNAAAVFSSFGAFLDVFSEIEIHVKSAFPNETFTSFDDVMLASLNHVSALLLYETLTSRISIDIPGGYSLSIYHAHTHTLSIYRSLSPFFVKYFFLLKCSSTSSCFYWIDQSG